jgi:transcriptional regulator BetI-like protein
MIRERLKRAKREGDLPADADPAALARFVTTVMQGMSVQAAGGVTRKELRAIADTALRAWPA